jgi:hypothetical protein
MNLMRIDRPIPEGYSRRYATPSKDQKAPLLLPTHVFPQKVYLKLSKFFAFIS